MNKFLLFLAALLPSVLVRADIDPARSPSALTVEYLQVTLEGARPLCPPGVQCVTDGTEVEVSMNVPCYAKLGPVAVTAVPSGNRLVVVVSAPIAYEPGGHQCQALIVHHERFSFVNRFGRVQLISLGAP